MGIRVALFLYCLFAIVQIRQKPGLQYDEALLVLGSVHMRHLPHEETPLPHDPGTWIQVLGRWFPLMTVRYVGAVKEYLGVPVFAIFGTRTAFIRILSMLLGLLGIWGVASLLRANLGARVAALTALALAINPSYVAMTTFDNGTVSIFMASLGLVCLAISAYLSRGTAFAAFAVGFAAGFGIWARVNFLWMAGAVLVAVILVLRKRMLQIPLAHWMAALGGVIFGSLPLIVYQVVSHGGTFEALSMFSSHEPLGLRLLNRLVMFSESLLSDREHRAMWSGPVMAWWQRWLFPSVVMAACVAGALLDDGCDRVRTLWARILTLCFLLFAASLFFTTLLVAEHHMVALLPFAVAITVLAGFQVAERFPKTRFAVVSLAILYAGCAFQWQTAAVAGLKRTGGVGAWSDGLVPLATRLLDSYDKQKDLAIKILDWGFANNLYVITDGRLPASELFGGATPERSGRDLPWMEEMKEGGAFVFFAPAHRQMPQATAAFLDALDRGSPLTRRFSVPQRDGAAYAEVIEVVPNTLHEGVSSIVITGDPGATDRLEGFHAIEGRWRWSKQVFAVSLDAPPLAGAAGVRLSVQGYIPESSIAQLGSLTLSARAGGHALAPETYRQAGTLTYTRDLRSEWLHSGPNRFEFALDKSLRTSDGRELGVVVARASLDAIR